MDYWSEIWKDALAEKVPPAEGDSYWPNLIDNRKLEYLTPHLPTNGTAVEVGCGSARLLCRVGRAAPALRLVAVDQSEAALALARRTAETFGVAITTAAGTVDQLPLDNDSVDVVLSGGLLEHFRQPMHVLKEMLRVLTPGGLLYADVVPRKTSWYRAAERARIETSEWLATGVFESTFGPADYRKWLSELGCSEIHTRWCGVYPAAIQHWGYRKRRLAETLSSFADGTPAAARWGWYFLLRARKSARPS